MKFGKKVVDQLVYLECGISSDSGTELDAVGCINSARPAFFALSYLNTKIRLTLFGANLLSVLLQHVKCHHHSYSNAPGYATLLSIPNKELSISNKELGPRIYQLPEMYQKVEWAVDRLYIKDGQHSLSQDGRQVGRPRGAWCTTVED